MELSIRNLLIGDTSQLRYVKRYSIFNVIHPESVAEHAYYTSLYSLCVGGWVIEEYGPVVNIGELLTRSLLHDVEESRTGDILRMFKHRDEETAAVIERASLAEVAQVFTQIFPSRAHEVPFSNLASFYMSKWENAKDSTMEGRIVAFADYLSVLGYLMLELQFANDSRVARTEDFRSYVEVFNAPEFDFIRPLVQQSQILVRSLFKVGPQTDLP